MMTYLSLLSYNLHLRGQQGQTNIIGLTLKISSPRTHQRKLRNSLLVLIKISLDLIVHDFIEIIKLT